MTEKLNEFGRGVLGVLSTPTMKPHKQELLALLGLPFVMAYSQILCETISFAKMAKRKRLS